MVKIMEPIMGSIMATLNDPNPSSTHSSAEDVDSDMALNWVTIKSDYHKG